jgi:hypothetical protein
LAKVSGGKIANLLAGTLHSHLWSMASLFLSLGLFAFQRWMVEYWEKRGAWIPYSPFADSFGARVGWGLLTSFSLAIIALFRERPPWIALLALGVAGFLIFALGMAA